MRNILSYKYFKDLVLLFFLTLIVYWPLSLNYLSLKNDALVYFAYRYHISEVIQHGYLPFWTPYFYTGFPIHADIQGGAWNPFVLLLSLFSKYDMTLLQWEVLIYLFISAAGMYRLIKHLGLSRITAIVCGVSFMSCGYMTNSVSVIPWIPSAAFIPFVLLYFLRLLKSGGFDTAIKFSFSLCLMFLCGYPSFFVYLNYIIGIIFCIWFFFQIRNTNKTVALKIFLQLALAYFLFALLCSPAIISYYEFLPYYSRGSGLSYEKAVTNPLLPFSFITYIVPNIASKASVPTDLAMRDAYIGLFVFLLVIAGLQKWNKFKTAIAAFTIFSVLFSLGDATPIQSWCYHFLPLMNTFRHPGTIRVFTTVGMILLAAFPLNAFLESATAKSQVQWLSALALAFTLLFIIYCITNIQKNAFSLSGLSPAALKQALYALSYYEYALIMCLLQFFFIVAFIFISKRKSFSPKAITALFLLNSIVFAWVALPFGVVSHYKTSEVNSFIHSFPDGYPLPDVHAPMEADVYSDSINISPHGYANFYNKKIKVQDHIVTPTVTSDYYRFLNDTLLRKQLKNHPFVYLTGDSVFVRARGIRVVKFIPNHFVFETNSSVPGKLELFQQFNPNWQAIVNGKSEAIHKSNIAFMSVNIPAGKSTVEWKYHPVNVYIAMIVSILSLLTVLFYFVFERKRLRTYE